jgi:hypothetical protein
LQSLFLSKFKTAKIADETVHFDVTPEKLMKYFMESYPPFTLSVEGREELRYWLLGEFDRRVDSKGLVHYQKGMRRIRAVK